MGLPMSGHVRSTCSGQRKHRPAALLVAAATALALAACGGGSGSSGGGSTIQQGGVFRMGTSSTIDSLNPFIAFQSDAYTTFEYIYPTLVQYTPALKIVANFARSWKTSPDGRTWTFTTVPNAKWSDGKPLTAADAAWTFSTIVKFADGATANSAGYVAHLKSATAPNATTLVLTYSQPVANVLSQVQQAPILPEHIWAQYATGNGKALKTFQNNAPIVSGGPFILTKYTPKQVALFKKNPAFYGPKPHIDGFGLQFFQTTDAEVTALKSGQLDGVEVPVPPTSVATLKAAHFQVRSSPAFILDEGSSAR
jgi:peptide/nickel transport system substrate-binding protein